MRKCHFLFRRPSFWASSPISKAIEFSYIYKAPSRVRGTSLRITVSFRCVWDLTASCFFFQQRNVRIKFEYEGEKRYVPSPVPICVQGQIALFTQHHPTDFCQLQMSSQQD